MRTPKCVIIWQGKKTQRPGKMLLGPVGDEVERQNVPVSHNMQYHEDAWKVSFIYVSIDIVLHELNGATKGRTCTAL